MGTRVTPPWREASSPWRYEVCPYSDTVDLLTIGGIRLKGQWQGKLGEQYMAWMPLPKRDKQKEFELGLGLEYLPEGFVPPVKKKTKVPYLASEKTKVPYLVLA